MRSPAVDEYLAALEPARREVLAAVRDLVLASLPSGFEEAFGHGMATWSVPLSRLPSTYNGEPLMLAALAAPRPAAARRGAGEPGRGRVRRQHQQSRQPA